MSKSKLSFSSEGKADDSDGFLEKSADERIFDGNLERFRSTAMPEMDNLAPIKERISTMEESMATQTYMNDLTGQLFHNLDTDLSNKEMNLQRVILQLEDNFRKEMDAMKKDYDHRYSCLGSHNILRDFIKVVCIRFDLQCAENQRLQQHISTLKAETNQIHRKLVRRRD